MAVLLITVSGIWMDVGYIIFCLDFTSIPTKQVARSKVTINRFISLFYLSLHLLSINTTMKYLWSPALLLFLVLFFNLGDCWRDGSMIKSRIRTKETLNILPGCLYIPLRESTQMSKVASMPAQPSFPISTSFEMWPNSSAYLCGQCHHPVPSCLVTPCSHTLIHSAPFTFIYFYFFVYIYIYHIYAGVPWRPEKDTRSHGTGVVYSRELPPEYWELDPILCKSSKHF